MIDVKCKGCNKLLAKAESMNAAIKCPRCKMIFEYHIYTNLFVSNYDNSVEIKNHLHVEVVNDTLETDPRDQVALSGSQSVND